MTTTTTFKFSPLPALSPNNQASWQQLISNWLGQIHLEINQALDSGVAIRALVNARAVAIDELLLVLFFGFELDKFNVALFAVGGYGRGELALHSDIDILLLTAFTDNLESNESNESFEINSFHKKIDALVALLWDVGLEPALSVRNLDECLQAARH